MSRLSEKIRKTREFTEEIQGWKLRLRRPTDAEAASILRGENIDFLEVAKRFVVDWEGVSESDFLRNASSDPLPFDADAWAEIVVDHPELWEPISTAVINAWTRHNDSRETRSKN